MYRVYQKSVRQTELLRDLRESVEREDNEMTNAETKKIHLSPTGNHFQFFKTFKQKMLCHAKKIVNP